MSNYFKNITISSLCVSNGHINQNKIPLTISVNDNKIFKITQDNVTINNNRVLTTLDLRNNLEKITFASGIFLDSGINYLRYCGNSDSGYDKAIRVSNIYRNPYSIKIRKISIQKGYEGANIISMPTLNYTKIMNGNFYNEEVDIDVGSDSYIYVSVVGTPMEIFVDLYFEIILNQLIPTTVNLSKTYEPTHYELFGYNDNTILSKYNISV